MCCFSLEIQQFRHINKINELMDAAKFEYFLGNMKDCENQSDQEKKKTLRMLIITVVFEDKSMATLQNKNQELQECL